MNKKYLFIAIAIMSLFINTSSSLINTIIYSIGVIPLAVLLGDFTSDLSQYVGEKRGGLVAATIGNLPELMMSMWSISYGMVSMVKSALVGSIISNMLLVLGISIFIGGIRYKEQRFNRLIARTNFNMLLLAMSAMVILASLNSYSKVSSEIMFNISLKISAVLIGVYLLGLVFSLYTHSNLFIISELKEESITKEGKRKRNVIISGIIACSIILFLISEKLVFNVKELIINYNLSQQFMGIIFIPILGNIGENFSAIICATKNKVNMSLEIAIGSSIQIALFVTPLLIISSYFLGMQMNFVFSNYQIIMSSIAIAMSFFVFQDGKTYWLEGAILIAIYLMITMGYYYLA